MESMASPRIEVLVFDAMYALIVAKGSRRELLAKVYTDDGRFKINSRRLAKIISDVRKEAPYTLDYTRNWVLKNRRILALVRQEPEERVTEEEALAKHVRVLSDRSLYEVTEDTKAMLRFAGKHFRLAIASNQEERFLLPMLENFKIAQYFEKVICSDQLGESKPNKQFFQRVYEEIGVSPKAACYFGNSIRNDLPASYEGRLVLIDYDGSLRLVEIGGGLDRVTIVRSMKQFRRWLGEQAKLPINGPAKAPEAAVPGKAVNE